MRLKYIILFCATTLSYLTNCSFDLTTEILKKDYVFLVCFSDVEKNKFVGVFSCDQIMEAAHPIIIDKKHCLYPEATWNKIAASWKDIKKPQKLGYYLPTIVCEKNKKNNPKVSFTIKQGKCLIELKNIIIAQDLFYEKGIFIPLTLAQDFELFLIDLHDQCSSVECMHSLPDIVQNDARESQIRKIIDRVSLALFLHYLHLRRCLTDSWSHLKSYATLFINRLYSAYADE